MTVSYQSLCHGLQQSTLALVAAFTQGPLPVWGFLSSVEVSQICLVFGNLWGLLKVVMSFVEHIAFFFFLACHHLGFEYKSWSLGKESLPEQLTFPTAP